MAKLSAKSRSKLPTSDFGLPGERKYPMPDKNHAAAAKSRATQMENKGKLSASSKAKIDKRANRVLDKDHRGSKGKWLKGRLEKKRVLKVGQPVTKEVLDLYGRHDFTLQATDDPNLWFIDFSVNKL